MNNRKYLRVILILVGVAVLGWFGHRALELRLHWPTAPALSSSLAATEIAAAERTFEAEISAANNQFARQAFFGLVGLFLALLGALPRGKIWIPKLLFSSGLIALIFHHLLADGKILSIVEQGIEISALWIALAFAVKATGMGCTVWRWKVLLEGQGFKIPLRHLVESFLIGRFIGSFSPGTSGLDGYRIYDISRYTGLVARSVSVIFVEKLIGFFVLGSLLLLAVPIGARLFAARAVDTSALVAMGVLFSGVMLASLVLLFRPGLIRWAADRLIPQRSPLRAKVEKALRAVTAYEHRKAQLAKATAISFCVHLCTIGMYFCTSRAIHELVPAADLFATAALMIGATIIPISIAGIGMREGVFAFMLGPVAAIYAFGGYLVEEMISLFGGPVWLARRGDYYEVMKAQRAAVNRGVEERIDDEPADPRPATGAAPEPAGPLASPFVYGVTGLGAGLVAGLAIAGVDAARLWLVAGRVDWSLPGYAALLYGPLLALLGAGLGALLALLGRFVRRPAAPPVVVGTTVGLWLFAIVAFVVGAFYFQRDLFGEKAGLLSPRLLGALAGLAAATALASVGVGFALRRLFAGARARLCKAWLPFAVYAIGAGALAAAWLAHGGAAKAGAALGPKPDRPRPNVLLVMSDTHRADYTGVYGGPADLTPNLDAFAADAIVYDHAFAQAPWTRPSVATILTGRYPSSHTATLKGSVLPDEVTTLPEVLAAGGYETIGVQTNYNLTPFFNFDQGFADYRYLTPRLPLGATDEQAKLIFIELYKKIEARLAGGAERPEDYYVIGEKVTDDVLARLDRRDKGRPFFLFAGYMDVHDPYFRHPYDGTGISHRANPSPDPNDAALVARTKELYAGEVRYWDAQFGRLIDGMKKRGLYDDTLIVVISDHGEEFADHGGFWHGTTLYDEQLEVIFVAKHPLGSGLAGGVRVDAWMRLLDVAPLIIDAAGLKIPAEMQGAPSPGNDARRPIFAETDHQGSVATSLRWAEGGAELKLIRANAGNPRGIAPLELYELNGDPGEEKDLAPAAPPELEKGTRALDAMAIQARRGAVKAETGALSAEQKRALEQLGYMKKGE
jgi:arylsulfatase A-like enzyme/uncharacterized membrane protein YbhN (UPF0104 family)